MDSPFSSLLEGLCSSSAAARESAANELYRLGRSPADRATRTWRADPEFSSLLGNIPRVTIGLAVHPQRFAQIRSANNSPRLAGVPPDQDAQEFELHFPGGIQLDILTTREPGGSGAVAKFLEKFGEGIQQVEYLCRNVDRATQILREEFSVTAIYPATRLGADGTLVNFFLVPLPSGEKVLIELYESPAGESAAASPPATSH